MQYYLAALVLILAGSICDVSSVARKALTSSKGLMILRFPNPTIGDLYLAIHAEAHNQLFLVPVMQSKNAISFASAVGNRVTLVGLPQVQHSS
jgi:hypothetical protein